MIGMPKIGFVVVKISNVSDQIRALKNFIARRKKIENFDLK